jgi:hypothetical protein
MGKSEKIQRSLLTLVFMMAIVMMFLLNKYSTVKGSNSFVTNGSPIISMTPFFVFLNPPTPIPGQNGQELLVEITQESRIVTEQINLATDISDKDKFVFIVRRSDGKFIMYLIPANFQGDERELMHLSSGDVIITGYPLDPRTSLPELIKPSINPVVPTQIYSNNSYPGPTPMLTLIPTSNPYP